ncbi:DUF5700 domain-containing putative Zn-dependent protease [Clostridium manihotivorum]|uniref:DUF2268 domain-containing protein n=1 Tax=Clostridium manihotivorum TaxID=2320868 RepID=A0A410DPB1_9CLOT|nr:DUF5700 domain-containing putative Zn-dependent protease [Clostridium manihotivorum]QAA30919.1 hypothetical protein C1I91_04145 [Clostridium manihotivorum]
MNIKFDYSALNSSLKIFEKIEKNIVITEDEFNSYLEEEGIKFLNKHICHYGGSKLNNAALIKFFASAIKNPKLESSDNIILKTIKQGLFRFSYAKETLTTLNLNQIADNSIKMANKFLPKPIDDDSNISIYFLYGIRGTSIMLNDKIAIDLCDEVLWDKDKINSEYLTRIIAHEVHHVGTDKHFKAVIDNINSDREKDRCRLLCELLSEGSAMYYLNNPQEFSTFKSIQWQSNDENIMSILSEIGLIIDKVVAGKLPLDEQLESLFGEGLKGYSAGYHMVELIDINFGVNAVLECILNIDIFMEYYHRAKQSISGM